MSAAFANGLAINARNYWDSIELCGDRPEIRTPLINQSGLLTARQLMSFSR